MNGFSTELTVWSTTRIPLVAPRPIPPGLLHELVVHPAWGSRLFEPRHVERHGRLDELADVVVAGWRVAQLHRRRGRDSRRSAAGLAFCNRNGSCRSSWPPTATWWRSHAEGPVYRIWTTSREGRPSVLIEESRWPLTAPSWSPRGKSIAFGRFVPLSIETTQPVQRGRLEILIQDGRDRKHVVWSLPDLELDAVARADLAKLRCSWSPDGLYLAVPRPWPQPAVEIVRTDTMKRMHILDRAVRPAWSPDGSKLAFFRFEGQTDHLEYVVRHGQNFSESRRIAATSGISAPPVLGERQPFDPSGCCVWRIGGFAYLTLQSRARRVVPRRYELDPRADAPDGEEAWSINRF